MDINNVNGVPNFLVHPNLFQLGHPNLFQLGHPKFLFL